MAVSTFSKTWQMNSRRAGSTYTLMAMHIDLETQSVTEHWRWAATPGNNRPKKATEPQNMLQDTKIGKTAGNIAGNKAKQHIHTITATKQGKKTKQANEKKKKKKKTAKAKAKSGAKAIMKGAGKSLQQHR